MTEATHTPGVVPVTEAAHIGDTERLLGTPVRTDVVTVKQWMARVDRRLRLLTRITLALLILTAAKGHSVAELKALLSVVLQGAAL